LILRYKVLQKKEKKVRPNRKKKHKNNKVKTYNIFLAIKNCSNKKKREIKKKE